jgi:hypothetical protein
MNVFTLVLGILFVGTGFVVLVHKLHDRSVHEALAVVRHARGDTARAIASFAGLTLPILSTIAGGIVLLALAVLSQARI